MGDLIQQNIGELVATLNSLLVSGIELTKENMPELLSQILQHAKAQAITMIWIGAIALIVAIVLIIIDGVVFDFDAVGLEVGAFLIISLGVGFLLAGIMTMIKLQNAPMLYLVQKVTSLVKI